MGGQMQAPFVHRGNPMHPMQVIFTGAGDVPPFAGVEAAIGPLPQLPAPHRLMRALPHAALSPREITGEILRDGNGRLYERVGDHVRALSQLYMGTRGEMIDLAPVRESPQPAPQAEAVEHAVSGDEDDAPETADGNGAEPRTRSFREVVRRLVPEPGFWRLVRYADFIDAITPQLADPRRLQPSHQLACYVQIYEVAVTIAYTALEEAAANELGSGSRLVPLSYDLCRKFALSLPRPAFALAAARHGQPQAPGIVAPGARFMTLRVALDPTGEAATPPAAPAAVAASPIAPPPPAPVAAGRTAIPEEYTKPWEMRQTRDEVLYDMTVAASRRGWRRVLEGFRAHVRTDDLKKWHALLSGKAPDEQLWGINPPRGGIADPGVRRWAEQALQLAGYEMPRMLVEWEIHWRRKGL